MEEESCCHAPCQFRLCGGFPGLYGEEHLAGGGYTLLALEGEFDVLLAWQEAGAGAAGQLLDPVTLGGALQGPDVWALCAFIGARRILVAYDADPAGAQGAAHLCARIPRGISVSLPLLGSVRPKDLTAFWRAGGDVRAWLTSLLEPHN